MRVKIVKKDLIMAVDEELTDMSIEEIAEGQWLLSNGVWN
jgi:hypothetical protein